MKNRERPGRMKTYLRAARNPTQDDGRSYHVIAR